MNILLFAALLAAAETEPLFYVEFAFDTVRSFAPTVSFSDDGKRIFVDKTVWDLESKTQVDLYQPPEGLLAFSPDGKTAVIHTQKVVGIKHIAPGYAKGTAVDTVYLWDVAKKKKVRKVGRYKFPCAPTGSEFMPLICPDIAANFSPDGKRFVLNVPVGPWAAEIKRQPEQPSGFTIERFESLVTSHEGKPRKLPGWSQFARDGRLLSIVFSNGTAQQVVDGDTGQRISFLRDGLFRPTNIEFSRDHGVLMMLTYKIPYFELASEVEVRAWETATGLLLLNRNLRSSSGDRQARYVLAPSGRFVIEGVYRSGERVLTAFDLRHNGKESKLPSFDHNGQVWLSPDGRYLAAQSRTAPRVLVYKITGQAAAPPSMVVESRINIDIPPTAKLPIDPNAYAIVIGVEKYRQPGIPAVDFAARDAATVHRYLTESLGFDPANVVLLQNEQATKTDLEKYLGPWLKNRIDEKSRLFIYYAGHGAPNPATGQGFLVPYEGDPNYTDVTAYPIQGLFDTLSQLPAKDVTVVLDACFSGSGGRSLLAKGARPLVVQSAAKAGGNTSVITAASGAQISASYPQGRHGLLTYFLLEGLHGAADADKDGAVTTAELFGYARPSVEREARKQNLEQTPTMAGPGHSVWLKAQP